MSNPVFTIIEGGLSAPKTSDRKIFAGAYITNTRLMGVMAMYVHWKLPDNPSVDDFHQFFYFDAEEYGFESYRSVLGNRVEEIASIEQTMVNGLGGHKVELSEEEVRAVIWKYMLFNQDRNIPLPEGISQYEFLLEEPAPLSEDAYAALVEKVCDTMASDFHVINYFLMRCFGHDYEAASWLCTEDTDPRLYQGKYGQATFYKNTIDVNTEDGSYLCESLIEYNGVYQLVISQLTVNEDLKVSSFEACSGFKVSSAEASMMVAKGEFITVYEVLTPVEEFASLLSQVPLNCLITPHQNGKLFMMFHNNNNHVDNQVFMLSADVAGIYYLSDSGQLLAVAYSLPEIHNLERDLRKSILSDYLMATGKYELKEPVLYDFIESEFEDFEEFLELIKI